MDFFADLRLVIPLLLNVIFSLFLKSQGEADKAWDQDVAVHILRYPFLFMLFFILALLLLLVFLFTPITLTVPLSVNRPVFMDSGAYTVLLALSILASFILQPWLFMVVYIFLIIISLRQTPPSHSTTRVNQNQEPAPARVEEIEMTEVKVERNHLMQNEIDLEHVIEA